MARPRCGKKYRLPKKIRKEALEELTNKTTLKPKEVKALYARFRRLAPSGYLLPEQFKQTMGVLGLTDDNFLPERMFMIFDADQDGKLSFLEFASSLAIMIRGTEDEKLQLSFEMVAGRQDAKGILLDDFLRLVRASNTLMSSLVVPVKHSISDEEAKLLFGELASAPVSVSEESVITLETYKEAARNNDDFLACLGIEPKGSKDHPRQEPRGQKVSPAPSPPLVAPAGHVLVSAAEIETLHEKVLALQKTALEQQRKFKTAELRRPTSPAPEPRVPEQQSPRMEADLVWNAGGSDSWWWTPWNCCRPSAPSLQPVAVGEGRIGDISAGPSNTLPSEEEILCESGYSSSGEQDAIIPDVVSELNGIIGWCKNQGLGSMAEVPTGSSPKRISVSAHAGRKDGVAKRPSVCRVGKLGADQPDQPRRRKKHLLLGPKKGLAVHFGHENWNMVLSMMIGIRMSVGRCKHEFAREIQPVDFIMKEKFSIIPRLANIFDSAVSKRVTMTRFIDYAPMVFQRIRSRFGINHDDYLRSVGPEQLLGNMVLGNLSSLSELSSEGKSGAFFYYTADGKYMLKTVSLKEHILLKKMLRQYYDYLAKNPGTLIVRFLGLHGISLQKRVRVAKQFRRSTRKVYFVVMSNMFNTPLEIHRRYDLKGSWVGREAHGDVDPTVAMKDVDFQKKNDAIRVGEDRRAQIITQIENDSSFLRDNNIIDYSLLLGIHEAEQGDDAAEDGAEADLEGQEPLPTSGRPRLSESSGNSHLPVHQRELGGILSSDRKSLYYFGIIDILTPWDTSKRLEHHLKALRYDRRGVSCCPPSMYAERFASAMQKVFV